MCVCSALAAYICCLCALLRVQALGGLCCTLTGPSSPSCPRLQFEIAHTTPRYTKVLAAVGPELVSSQDRLNKVRSWQCLACWLPMHAVGPALLA